MFKLTHMEWSGIKEMKMPPKNKINNGNHQSVSTFFDRHTGKFKMERNQGEGTEILAERQIKLNGDPAKTMLEFVYAISETVLDGKVTKPEGIRLIHRCRRSYVDVFDSK